MRLSWSLLIALCAAVAGTQGARAQTGPVIVVPGKPGVPVIINGVVADGAVVWGDWGLGRGGPGPGAIVIEGPVGLIHNFDERGYYPSMGHAPLIGRLEVEPAPHPRPDTSYHREWSTGSDMSRPVTEYPPFNPPTIIEESRGKQPQRKRGSQGTQARPGSVASQGTRSGSTAPQGAQATQGAAAAPASGSPAPAPAPQGSQVPQ
ncbi:MAG TPA: hypothetical protein VK456_11740 [Xanthobacteraceae bacterium]|nr:hypothetical protein [Xanthobacteraceae bacterium]